MVISLARTSVYICDRSANIKLCCMGKTTRAQSIFITIQFNKSAQLYIRGLSHWLCPCRFSLFAIGTWANATLDYCQLLRVTDVRSIIPHCYRKNKANNQSIFLTSALPSVVFCTVLVMLFALRAILTAFFYSPNSSSSIGSSSYV